MIYSDRGRGKCTGTGKSPNVVWRPPMRSFRVDLASSILNWLHLPDRTDSARNHESRTVLEAVHGPVAVHDVQYVTHNHVDHV